MQSVSLAHIPVSEPVRKQLEEGPSDAESETGTIVSVVDPVLLADHIAINMNKFDERFHDFVLPHEAIHEPAVLIHRQEGKFLRTHSLVEHSLMHPDSYRKDGFVHGATFPQVMEFLRGFRGCVLAETGDCDFQGALLGSTEDYNDLFGLKPKLEQDINSAATKLLYGIVLRASRDQLRCPSQSERISASAGLWAKRCLRNPQRIETRAGAAGKVDTLLNFGDPERQDNPKFAAIEYKFLRSPIGEHRWFTATKALLAQSLGSLIGHQVPVCLAVCQEGFKVFVREVVAAQDLTPQERQFLADVAAREPDKPPPQMLSIRCFPPSMDELYIPNSVRAQGSRIDQGLAIFGEIARIIAHPRAAIAAAQDNSAPESPTRTSRPNSPPTLPHRSSSAAARSNEQSPSTQPPARDQQYFLRTRSGEFVEVTSVCLESRFTPGEIEELMKPVKPVNEAAAAEARGERALTEKQHFEGRECADISDASILGA